MTDAQHLAAYLRSLAERIEGAELSDFEIGQVVETTADVPSGIYLQHRATGWRRLEVRWREPRP